MYSRLINIIVVLLVLFFPVVSFGDGDECLNIGDGFTASTNIFCQGGTPCDNTPPLDKPTYTCLCTYQATAQEAPPLTEPTGVTWLETTLEGSHIEGNSIPGVTQVGSVYTFPAGTYYFKKLKLTEQEGNVAHIIVSGPVTIWIKDEFRMEKVSTFNYPSPYTTPGDPANVLLLAAKDETKFEIKESSKFSGGIYALNGAYSDADSKVKVTGGAQVFGAIASNEVELKNNTTTITHAPTAGMNTTGYPLILGVVTASGWEEK